MVERFHLGGVKTGRGVRLGLRELPVLAVLAHTGLTRLTLLLAIRVDERVCQDRVEPGLEVGAFLELVEGGEGFDERLLDEVLGVGRVAGHPQCRGVELVEKRERCLLEARTALLERLLGHGARCYVTPHDHRRRSRQGRGPQRRQRHEGCNTPVRPTIPSWWSGPRRWRTTSRRSTSSRSPAFPLCARGWSSDWASR